MRCISVIQPSPFKDLGEEANCIDPAHRLPSGGTDTMYHFGLGRALKRVVEVHKVSRGRRVNTHNRKEMPRCSPQFIMITEDWGGLGRAMDVIGPREKEEGAGK